MNEYIRSEHKVYEYQRLTLTFNDDENENVVYHISTYPRSLSNANRD